MSKVLFIGNILEKSGWGNCCRHYVRSLKSVGGLDVVCRPVTLGLAGEVDTDIEDCIKKDSRGSEYLIQMVLPHHMMYQGGIKNFGISLVETTNLKYNIWVDYLNLMDEIWIPNKENITEVTKKQFTIPPPIDVEKYYKKYPKIKISGLEGRYKFYSICDLNKRKNILGLIVAYYRAFSYSDMTALILKINKHGKNSKELQQEMNDILESIKIRTGLKHTFPPVIFITDYYSEEQICALHQYCDCYIAPSFGEAINYPLLDACGFGNKAISSDVAGPRYMKENGLNVKLVQTHNQPCYDAEHIFNGHNNLFEDWGLTNLNSLAEAMKENVGDLNKCYTNMHHFSYENVGESMIERLFSQ